MRLNRFEARRNHRSGDGSRRIFDLSGVIRYFGSTWEPGGEPERRAPPPKAFLPLRVKLSDATNPYQPSPTPEESDSTWTKILRSIIGDSRSERTLFRNGNALLHEGISFFVKPDDQRLLYAASPSADHSTNRMNLIVAEVIRILPLFLADHPKLKNLLRGRTIVVRMIDNYAQKQAEFVREEHLEWDILNCVLADERRSNDPDNDEPSSPRLCD